LAREAGFFVIASSGRLGHGESLIAGKIHLMDLFGMFLSVGDNLIVALPFDDETAGTIDYLFHGASFWR
jgi:hypothetical protein